MKKRLTFFIILATLATLGCERGTKLSPMVSRFIVSKHLLKMDGSEKLSKNIQHFILSEQNRSAKNEKLLNLTEAYTPKKRPKFPLPYYLIPDHDSSFSFSRPNNDKINDQLIMKISGKKHYKLFIHPGQEVLFDFLRRSYNYVGPDHTEFFATPTSKSTSLLVWNKNNSDRSPFVVEVVLPKKESEQNRKISSSNKVTGEVSESKEFLGEQVVKEIPVNNAK